MAAPTPRELVLPTALSRLARREQPKVVALAKLLITGTLFEQRIGHPTVNVIEIARRSRSTASRQRTA
eukprot:11157484-Lingulodinium_polyedra.AAC.1